MSRNTPILIVLALVLVAGCNSSTAPSDLNIVPGRTNVESGRSVQLEVIDGSGAAVGGASGWSSSKPIVARVDANGVVTGVYPNSTTIVSARVGAVTVTSEVTTVPRICFAIADLQGAPDPNEEIQTFRVRFDSGIDPTRTAQEMADRYGFVIDEITVDGFVAQLTADQASHVLCEVEVASMTYQ